MAKKNNTILLAGLGNPGPDYFSTYHNLGFLFLNKLSQKLKLTFNPAKGSFYLAQKGNLYLLKPTTYMNLSGIALTDFFKKYAYVNPDNIVVIHDDLDVPKFSVKMKFNGHSAGHKGIESIIYYLETDSFWRIKIGIGRKKDISPRDYVLSPIDEQSITVYNKLFEDMSDILQNIDIENLNKIQERINILRNRYVKNSEEA